MKKLTVLASLFLSSSFAVTGALAQDTQELTSERIFSSPALEGKAPRKLKVSPDGQRVTFIQGKVSDYERYDLWEYHVESGKTQVLFDADNLHTGDETLSDEEKARRERSREDGTDIIAYQWTPDDQALWFQQEKEENK